jgi:hypothetical protein
MAELSLTYRNGMVAAVPVSDDNEDESPGRVLTPEEFIDRLRNRSDIFGVEKNYRLRNTEVITVLLAIVAGMLLSSIKPAQRISSDFYGKKAGPESTVTLRGPLDRPFNKPAEMKKPVVANVNERKALRKTSSHSSGQNMASGGVGNARSRVVKTGILALLSSQVRARDASTGELFTRGGFAEKIDAIMSGVHGINRGGGNSSGRRNAEGIGFGVGYGPSGFGGAGPGGGIGDLMGNDGADQVVLAKLPHKTGPPMLEQGLNSFHSGTVIGGRSRIEVLHVVMQNIAALRYAYNQRLREKPGLKGKITIRFAIDEFGNVIHCEVVASSMQDNVLEATVSGKIMRWKFDKVDKPGDITEIVYPFVFST